MNEAAVAFVLLAIASCVLLILWGVSAMRRENER